MFFFREIVEFSKKIIEKSLNKVLHMKIIFSKRRRIFFSRNNNVEKVLNGSKLEIIQK